MNGIMVLEHGNYRNQCVPEAVDDDHPWLCKAFGPCRPDIVLAEYLHHCCPASPQYTAYIKYGQDQTGQDQDVGPNLLYVLRHHTFLHGQYPKLNCKHVNHHKAREEGRVDAHKGKAGWRNPMQNKAYTLTY